MDFEYEASYQAELVRTALSPDDDEPMLAIVILKLTYDVGLDGSLALAKEQLPVDYEARETDLGVFPNDIAAIKPGCDVFVMGHAEAPQGEQATDLRVRLAVGGETREVAVFGDRHWEKKNKRLVMSDPEPFEKIALSFANAYGGKTPILGYELPHGYNPGGKGYVMQEDHADGVELPNIEDPQHLIQTWEDQPQPASFAPVALETLFTVDRGIEYDEETKQQRVKPEFFQNAHPDLVFQELEPGTPITLEGMSAEPFAFSVPCVDVAVTVDLGENSYQPAGKLDTLCILPDERRLFVIHRTPFKYKVVPEELRVTRLAVKSTGVAMEGAG